MLKRRPNLRSRRAPKQNLTVDLLGGRAASYIDSVAAASTSRIARVRRYSLRHYLLCVAPRPLSLHCITSPFTMRPPCCVQLLERTDSQLYLLLTLPAGRDVASAVSQFVSAQWRGCVDRPIASGLSIPPSWNSDRETVALRGEAWADEPQTWCASTWQRCMFAPIFG